MNDPVPSARKRLFLWLLGAILVGCVVILPFQNAEAETESNSRDDGQVNSDLPKQSNKIPVHLYFADRNNSFLKSELRVMLQPDDPLEFGRTIVEALIKGPQKGLIPDNSGRYGTPRDLYRSGRCVLRRFIRIDNKKTSRRNQFRVADHLLGG